MIDLDTRLLRPAARRLTPLEARHLLAACNRHLDPGPHGEPIPNLRIVVRQARRSTAFNALALLLQHHATALAADHRRGSWPQHAHVLGCLRLALEQRLDAVDEDGPAPAQGPPSAGAAEEPVSQIIALAYQSFLGRSAGADELAYWLGSHRLGGALENILLDIAHSEEARAHRDTQAPLPNLSDGRFILFAHQTLLRQAISSAELDALRDKLEQGSTDRRAVLHALLERAYESRTAVPEPAPQQPHACPLIGTSKLLTLAEWQARLQALRSAPNEPAPPSTPTGRTPRIQREPGVLVSAIASLYGARAYVERFMENVAGQQGFDDFCELIIIDAASPEGELEFIQPYLERHRNIRYIRTEQRIGIYAAWNMGAKAARGRYLTNTNLDDLRRDDSLMLQAELLERLPFVDVVYQDFYYTLDPHLPFQTIARLGYSSVLPVVTPQNMMHINSPHNAPMWRKGLHDELGYFDEQYRSAGDYEFWLRCMAAGKVFYKSGDRHVAYFHNPDGLSTGQDSSGVQEAQTIQRQYGSRLVSDHLLTSAAEFVRQLTAHAPAVMPDARLGRQALAQRALESLGRQFKVRAGPSGTA